MEIKKTNIDETGKIQSYMPATPIGMLCEYTGCNSSEGKDYIRKEKSNDGWDDEPIFLCEKHSIGYKEYK